MHAPEADIATVVMQNAQVQLRDAVLHQYSELQHELSSSEVVELPAGVPYLLKSSAVLLKGTIKVSGRLYSESRKGIASTNASLINIEVLLNSDEITSCSALSSNWLRHRVSHCWLANHELKCGRLSRQG